MLNGKTCLITGASRGIGEAIATTYAREKATLFLVARNKDRLKLVAENCRDLGAQRVEFLSANLDSVKSAEEVAKYALKEFVRIDVLVNNAGIVAPSGLTCVQGIPTEWDEMVQLNLLVPMTLMHELVPKMVEQRDGVVVNIGSMAGKNAYASFGAYSATKWALRGWSLSCYEELREHNVKVCSINPGFVHTDMTKVFDKIDPKKMIQPADVGQAALLPFRLSANCLPMEIDLARIQEIDRSE